MAPNNMPPRYPMPTAEDTRGAAEIASGLTFQTSFSTAAGAVDIHAQPMTYSPCEPVVINVQSFFEAAEAKNFTPIVEVSKENGLPAKDLQTGANIFFPRGTNLILGAKIPGSSKSCNNARLFRVVTRTDDRTASRQVARVPNQHFTARVELSDMFDAGVYVSRASLKFLCDADANVERRVDSFYGLESLYVLKSFKIRAISGIITIQAGDVVCHGWSPAPMVKGVAKDEDFAILRATNHADQNAEHYIVLQRHAVESMATEEGIFTIADGTVHTTVQGIEDYTRADQDFSAVQEWKPASSSFDACGEWLNIVHIRQGQMTELRYKQADSLYHYYNLATSEVFVAGPPQPPSGEEQVTSMRPEEDVMAL